MTPEQDAHIAAVLQAKRPQESSAVLPFPPQSRRTCGPQLRYRDFEIFELWAAGEVRWACYSMMSPTRASYGTHKTLRDCTNSIDVELRRRGSRL